MSFKEKISINDIPFDLFLEYFDLVNSKTNTPLYDYKVSGNKIYYSVINILDVNLVDGEIIFTQNETNTNENLNDRTPEEAAKEIEDRIIVYHFTYQEGIGFSIDSPTNEIPESVDLTEYTVKTLNQFSSKFAHNFLYKKTLLAETLLDDYYFVFSPVVIKAQKLGDDGKPLYINSAGVIVNGNEDNFTRHQKAIRSAFYSIPNDGFITDMVPSNKLVLYKSSSDYLAYWKRIKKTTTYIGLNSLPENISASSIPFPRSVVDDNELVQEELIKQPVIYSEIHGNDNRKRITKIDLAMDSPSMIDNIGTEPTSTINAFYSNISSFLNVINNSTTKNFFIKLYYNYFQFKGVSKRFPINSRKKSLTTFISIKLRYRSLRDVLFNNRVYEKELTIEDSNSRVYDTKVKFKLTDEEDINLLRDPTYLDKVIVISIIDDNGDLITHRISLNLSSMIDIKKENDNWYLTINEISLGTQFKKAILCNLENIGGSHYSASEIRIDIPEIDVLKENKLYGSEEYLVNIYKNEINNYPYKYYQRNIVYELIDSSAPQSDLNNRICINVKEENSYPTYSIDSYLSYMGRVVDDPLKTILDNPLEENIIREKKKEAIKKSLSNILEDNILNIKKEFLSSDGFLKVYLYAKGIENISKENFEFLKDDYNKNLRLYLQPENIDIKNIYQESDNIPIDSFISSSDDLEGNNISLQDNRDLYERIKDYKDYPMNYLYGKYGKVYEGFLPNLNSEDFQQDSNLVNKLTTKEIQKEKDNSEKQLFKNIIALVVDCINEKNQTITNSLLKRLDSNWNLLKNNIIISPDDDSPETVNSSKKIVLTPYNFDLSKFINDFKNGTWEELDGNN